MQPLDGAYHRVRRAGKHLANLKRRADASCQVKSDAVVVLAKSATLADAAATATGNLIHRPADITGGIDFARGIQGLEGVVIIKDDKVGFWGKAKICQT